MGTKCIDDCLGHVFFPNVYCNIICDVVAKMSAFEPIQFFGLLIARLTKAYRVFKKFWWSTIMPQYYVTLKRGAWFSLSGALGRRAFYKRLPLFQATSWVEVSDDGDTSLTTRRHNLGYFIYKERLVLPEMKSWSYSHCTDWLALCYTLVN
jgi:hypothetical protein